MSQLRAMCREHRAAISVAAICALIFGLLVTGAARPAHALQNDFGKTAIACDHAAHHAGAATDQEPARNGSLRHKCPDCCLAAHAGTAVLPTRFGAVTRPGAATAATVRYPSGAARQPDGLATSPANGARAPPAI